ncbi:hypothetical protein AB1484_10350 [Parafrankia sp. FMc6]|uniref:alpha/beta fold hydrolase n=1 Tax=Parafrankia soli TaxID=2599596 RepID=UPI0034D3E1B0
MPVESSDGVRIGYEILGQGKPLVLLHGFFGDREAELFRTRGVAPFIDHLERQGALPDWIQTADRLARAVVVELPGCGHFDAFVRSDLSVPPARTFLSTASIPVSRT